MSAAQGTSWATEKVEVLVERKPKSSSSPAMNVSGSDYPMQTK
jgi:hypothetical protein